MPRQTIVLGIKSFVSVFVLSVLTQLAFATSDWRQLAPGIEYQDLESSFLMPWSHVHAFRISLKDNDFSLLTAHDLSRKHASVDEYAQYSKALLAINGGFFDGNYKPLGLRIYNKRQKNPAKNISWWGIFYIKNQRAYITTVKQYSSYSQIDFAVQSGPRLLINNRIPPLKPGRSERSALGITQDGRIIILVTDNMPMSTTELAQLMKAPPLHCENALNLDGGSSSQLRAQIGSFQLDVHGFSNVSDAILVKTRP